MAVAMACQGLPTDTKVPVFFEQGFKSTDQDVKDLEAPKPDTKWCLLEIPDNELEALMGGSTFYFQSQEGGKGLDDGGAALSTDTKTYDLEFLENSNSLFIGQMMDGGGPPAAKEGDKPEEEVPGGASCRRGMRCDVFGQVRGQLFTKLASINVKRLRTLLAPQAMGQDLTGMEVVTLGQLQHALAASPAEIQTALDEGPYVEIDGTWRLLLPATEREVVDTAVNVVAAKGWDPTNVNEEELLADVQAHLGVATVPTIGMLRKVLRTVRVSASGAVPASAPASGSTPPDGEASQDSGEARSAEATAAGEPTQPPATVAEGCIALDRKKIDRFTVLELLRMPPNQVRDKYQLPAPPPPQKKPRLGAAPPPRDGLGGQPLTEDELAAALQEVSGAAERPSTDELWKVIGGVAYKDEFEGTLHPFDITTLPKDPRERLRRLFDIQSYWHPARLSKLIAPSLGAGVKVDTWLLKQARSVFFEFKAGEEERLVTRKFALS